VLVLDLQWLLFFGLLAIVIGLAAIRAVDQWLQRRRRRRLPLGSAKALEAGLDQAPFGVLLLEGRQTCRFANAQACRLLGLTARPERLPAAPWSALLEADRDAARHDEAALGRYRTLHLADSFGNGSAQAEERRPVVRWWVMPVAEQDLVFLLDVTHQQRAEDAMRSLVNDLAHELRTPLATVLTHLEVLSLAHVSDEIRRQSMQLLKSEAGRMVRLLHQMLELGRVETAVEMERRPLDLLALVEATLLQIAPEAQARGIALSLEANAPLPLLEGDEDRLRQVFLNLLDNAVKYCRPGDAVAISLRREQPGIRCTIQDTGPGIPAERLAYVTRRFFRAAPSEVTGSGLGLTLVTEILRRHQSELEIESRADGEQTGTCVRFLLPIHGPSV
jgi:two-component system phosphate regulon sensor histidine kinase PhoR